MEFMSCGKPAIAPLNTAMADYVDSDNAFIVDSTDELTAWPHDPRAAYRTLRYMTDWDSLCAAYRDSYEVAKNDVERYARMSGHAVHNLQKFCSQASAEERLRRFCAARRPSSRCPWKPRAHDPRLLARLFPAPSPAAPAPEPSAQVSPRMWGCMTRFSTAGFAGQRRVAQGLRDHG
jgi:hypothetical protein